MEKGRGGVTKTLGSILERATPATPPASTRRTDLVSGAVSESTSTVVVAEAEPVPRPASAPKAKDVPLQVLVPEPIRRQLEIRAAGEGITKRTYILRALKQAGLDVPEKEIRDRRKS